MITAQVIEDRIRDPAGFDHEAHFQHAWSGETFANAGSCAAISL